jgi:hypothetical protein
VAKPKVARFLGWNCWVCALWETTCWEQLEERERESQREREAAHLESTLRDNMLRGWHLEREREREHIPI